MFLSSWYRRSIVYENISEWKILRDNGEKVAKILNILIFKFLCKMCTIKVHTFNHLRRRWRWIEKVAVFGTKKNENNLTNIVCDDIPCATQCWRRRRRSRRRRLRLYRGTAAWRGGAVRARQPRRRLTCYWASSGGIMRYRTARRLYGPYGGGGGPGDWSRDRAERRRRYARRVQQAQHRAVCVHTTCVRACVRATGDRALSSGVPAARAFRVYTVYTATAAAAAAEQGRSG